MIMTLLGSISIYYSSQSRKTHERIERPEVQS